MFDILREYSPALRRLKKYFKRMWFWLPIVAILEPGRVPPRRGILRNWCNSRVIEIRRREGGSFRCCIAEFFVIVEIYGLAIYEYEELNYRQAKCIVDIGANVGVATVWLGQMAPDANILAIEPDARSAKLLQDNILGAGISRRAEVVVAAVGGSTGSGIVVRSSISSTVSQVAPALMADPLQGGIGQEPAEFISVLTLSDVLDLTGPIDIMKIDCEGSEFDFFGSATPSSLSKIQKIVGEYHLASGSFETLRECLSAAGFKVRSISEDDIVGLFVAVRSTFDEGLPVAPID